MRRRSLLSAALTTVIVGAALAINQTYTADVSSETANGTWKLRVRDLAVADLGTVDTWSLDLNPA